MINLNDLKLIIDKRKRINDYQLCDWNGGYSKYQNDVDLNKHNDLKIIHTKITTKTKIIVNKNKRTIKFYSYTLNKSLNFTMNERYLIFKRANWKCQKCGSEYNLHADHIIPKSLNPLKAHDWKNNGRALCPICHANREENEYIRKTHKENKLLNASAYKSMKYAKITKELKCWKIFEIMQKDN